MNLLEEIEKLKTEGYNEEHAQARLCQDIILQGIANSKFNRQVTIKGGVVMRNLSSNSRRATLDVDVDLICFPLTDTAIEDFVRTINTVTGIQITKAGSIEDLVHQDYHGKRIYVAATDKEGNSITSKVDIGIHKDLDIKQDEYCFDICYSDDGASLLMNSPAQIIAEKIKSLLKFGTRSTRYKDIFDIYYLQEKANRITLKKCIERGIYNDASLNIPDNQEFNYRLKKILTNKSFKQFMKSSRKNWLDIDDDVVLTGILNFFKSLLN